MITLFLVTDALFNGLLRGLGIALKSSWPMLLVILAMVIGLAFLDRKIKQKRIAESKAKKAAEKAEREAKKAAAIAKLEAKEAADREDLAERIASKQEKIASNLVESLAEDLVEGLAERVASKMKDNK
ncbi:MAG: hypothetical protein LBI44_05310 [Oscillospiraceae bacterium]|jgi:biopolymer transport protein ExbB/TolQ|nr:hypothetical protein [Oscillospiraceae bacterium]